MINYQLSIILAILFAIGELFTTTFVLLSFSLSFLLIATVQFLLGNFDLNREIGFFIFGSLFFSLLLRKLFKGSQEDESIQTNNDINKY